MTVTPETGQVSITLIDPEFSTHQFAYCMKTGKFMLLDNARVLKCFNVNNTSVSTFTTLVRVATYVFGGRSYLNSRPA